MNTLAHIARNFNDKVTKTVEDIISQGNIFAGNVRREMIVQHASKRGDFCNLLADCIKAAMVAETGVGPAEAEHYQMVREELEAAQKRISQRTAEMAIARLSK